MFASLIFRKEPFFHGHDNYDQVSVCCCVSIEYWFGIIEVYTIYKEQFVSCFLSTAGADSEGARYGGAV